MTFDQSLELAIKNNPDLLMAQNSSAQAEEAVTKARSEFFPSLSLGFSGSRAARVYTITVGTREVETEPSQSYRLGLSLSQSLFTAGRMSANLQSAVSRLKNARQNYIRKKQEVVYSVKQAYFEFLAKQRLLKIAEETVKRMEKHKLSAKLKFEAGKEARTELLKAEADLEKTQLDVLKATHARSLAKAQFLNILGINKIVEIKIEEIPISEIKIRDLKYYGNLAFKKRPEFFQYKAKLEEAQASIHTARSGYFPSLSLSAGYNWRKYGELTGDWSPSWNLGFSGSMSLFDGFSTAAKVADAEIGLNSVQIEESSFKKSLLEEIEEAYYALVEAENYIEVTKKYLIHYEEKLKMEEIEYKAGMGTLTDVLDAELERENARNDLVSAETDFLVAQAELDLAVGIE